MIKDEIFVQQLKKDYTQANLTPSQRAMLDYVAKLTRKPWTLTKQDILQLKEQGFTDRAILDINQIAAYYAYVNRLADGLGVELEHNLK